jgi:hypothetical protein
MKYKMKDVQDDFYEFSSKASALTRQLALAGVAVVWIFKTTTITNHIKLEIELIEILKQLIICLLFDFAHALIPSLVYGIMNFNHRVFKKKKDDDEINYSMIWTIPEWILFTVKVIFLLIAYFGLWNYLQQKII